jgi:uncharacterized protein with PIN domain
MRSCGKGVGKEMIGDGLVFCAGLFELCSRCDRLFWRGTHWTRIERQLKQTLAIQ